MQEYCIQELFSLSETIVAEIFEGVTYPWEVLPKIKEFILKLGPTLSEERFEKRGEDVWVAKSATVFDSAYLGGPCIIDEEAVCKASQQEIIRRYYAALVEKRKGSISSDIVEKEELLMEKANISIADRPVVAAAKQKAELTNGPAAAISLPDGSIVTGKTTPLLGACAAMLLNALKKCAGLPDDLKVISPEIIEPIQHLKVEHLGNHNPRLHTDEILIALTISANTDENAEKCMEQLAQLNQCEMHSTVILSQIDEKTLGKLGIRLSCEPQYQNKKLFHS